MLEYVPQNYKLKNIFQTTTLCKRKSIFYIPKIRRFNMKGIALEVVYKGVRKEEVDKRTL